ncbi:YlbF/YmcA family competence regulator [Streptococcus sp. DD12]|uniref:YlbF/YmcA family competence regulator n=1 Tax=Streptococcus sp. DD12 TaxID=1777880 RepID=UPI00079774B7|nr:YlbF/YmcA family competence regulator [Streptococcus sp. DD12]KXT76873.1 hypothetical protein STRDD12_00007 [Streptococcus sp. DD12]
MSVNVYDLANALERGLRQLPEYQAVKDAKAAIQADEAAQAILTEFLHLQEHFQQAMATGQMPTEADQSAMAAVSEKIEGNPLVKAYFDQQQRLGVYIQDIEGIIFKPLQELMQND